MNQTLDERIESFINKFCHCSLYGDLNGAKECLDQSVVFIQAVSGVKLTGINACMKSIEEYHQIGKTLHFNILAHMTKKELDRYFAEIEYDVTYVIKEKTYKEKCNESFELRLEPDEIKIAKRILSSIQKNK